MGEIKIINIRVDALKGKRKARVGARSRFELLPVYDRYRLTIGAMV